MITLPLIIFLLMCAAGRMHGIGDDKSILKFKWEQIIADCFRSVSTIIVGVSVGLASAIYWNCDWAIFLGAVSGTAFVLGHGNFYEMLGARDGIGNPPSKPEEIENYGGRWLWNFLTGNVSIRYPIYSFFMMGLKWLLIGLPLGPYALLIGIFAPTAYKLSFSKTGSSPLAEWLTTIFCALVTALIFLS